MKVKFSFDKTAAERRGYGLETVCQTVKSLFSAHGFPCISDDGVLGFEDKGHGDDFAVMWEIILSLLRSEWFMDCAASCIWEDENGEEDVISQAGKVRASPANFNHSAD